MRERYKALSAKFLAEYAQCCECFCQNCPFVPRHEGGVKVDWEWVKFNQENPDVAYADYLVRIKRSDP